MNRCKSIMFLVSICWTMKTWYFIFHKYYFLKDLITYDSVQNECEKWQIKILEIKNDDNEKYTFVARFSNFLLRPIATIKIFSSCLSLSSVSFSQYIHLQYIHCYYSENEKLNTNCRWLHIHQIKNETGFRLNAFLGNIQ